MLLYLKFIKFKSAMAKVQIYQDVVSLLPAVIMIVLN